VSPAGAALSAPRAAFHDLQEDDLALEALMMRYRDGDDTAFRALHAAVAPRLRVQLLRLTRDRVLTEDLLQMTFVKVHRHRASYVEGSPPLPWFATIARRTYMDERRQMRRRGHARSVSLDDAGAMLSSEDPTEHCSITELEERFRRAIAALPEQQRVALLLTKIDGLSLVAAAGALNTTPAAVKLRSHRASARLRMVLTAAA
jgi:RNA polymerase sigma-70 factor, ECF subfamily